MRGAGTGIGPDKGRQRGDEQLDDHPRGPDEHALPTRPEAPRRAGVHVGDGGEDHQHHAHHMHLAAIAFAAGRVAELMQNLDESKPEEEEREIVRREHILPLHLQLVHVLEGEIHPRADDRQPEQRAQRAEEPAEVRLRDVEEGVRVKQREPREHDVHQARAGLALAGLLEALEELRGVGGLLVEQQVGLIELPQQLDHRLLARGLVWKFLNALLPHLLDGAVRTQPAHEGPGLRTQPEELIVEGVLQNNPPLAAERLPARGDPLAQGKLLVRYAIPGLTEGCLRFGHRGWF